MTPARLCALLLCTVVLLSGCSQESDDATTVVSDDGPRDSYTVTLAADPQGGQQSWTLTCRPAGGSHPDASAACAALAASADPFAPVPRDVACTQIFGGPAVGTITGTQDGRRVAARYTRTNGCEISRWDAIGVVFPGELPD
ncbi:MAG TPA: SSI family serine proteinase inhibitor [Mycobacteriales bacterium]|nr:SSI family serine proteinase inhibitor [Mycobacteriales bacterium]